MMGDPYRRVGDGYQMTYPDRFRPVLEPETPERLRHQEGTSVGSVGRSVNELRAGLGSDQAGAFPKTDSSVRSPEPTTNLGRGCSLTSFSMQPSTAWALAAIRPPVAASGTEPEGRRLVS